MSTLDCAGYKPLNVDKHRTDGTFLVDKMVDRADGQVLVDMVDKVDSQTLVDAQSDATKSERVKVTDKTVTTDISDINPTVNDVNKLDNILNPNIVDSTFTDDNPSIDNIDGANKNVIYIPVDSDKDTTVDVSVDSNVNTNNTSVKMTLDNTNLSGLSELFQQPEQIDWNRLINLDKSDLVKWQRDCVVLKKLFKIAFSNKQTELKHHFFHAG